MARTINLNDKIHARFRRNRDKERSRGSSTLSDPGFIEVLLALYEEKS